MDILLKFSAINDKVTIKWYSHEDEEDIEDAGKAYEEIVDDVQFEFIKY